jgi:putative oxygen-independent coproporphyrinogen III oxidase
MSNKSIGLYIHIPFCKSKCNYCDFNSYQGKEVDFARYFEVLQQEIRYYSAVISDRIIDTVFIGGGTPSLVDTKYIYELLKCCRNYLNIDNRAEASIESNPGTVTYEKLLTYRVNGINRLSMGLQAWQDRLLKELGRIHTAEDFVINHEAAAKAGFRNLNVDLIFGLPGQTMNDWSITIQNILKLGFQHISCYSLKIEEGTVFGKMLEEGRLEPADEELDRRMYWYAVDEFVKAGYSHYEISNFALPGYECRHNMRYWKALEYLGVGAGAHSYLDGCRFNNVCGIDDYIEEKSKDAGHRENIERIDKKESMSEFMILGFRLVDGIRLQDFKARYGTDIYTLYGKQIEKLMRKQLLELEDEKLRLTPFGLDVANEVFVEFV